MQLTSTITDHYIFTDPNFPSESVQMLFFNEAVQGVHESLVWEQNYKMGQLTFLVKMQSVVRSKLS